MKRLFFLGAASYAFAVLPPANPPTWPSATVKAYTPASGTIVEDFAAAFTTNGGGTDNGQFVNSGFAFLFAPGTYSDYDLEIGYYTSVIGMGVTPDDTSISNINSPPSEYPDGNSLNTFWRSAENFSTSPTGTWGTDLTDTMTWAVSQASPLRRINIYGSLALFHYGESSGGFIADCRIAPTSTANVAVESGSQQQWLSRNTELILPNGTTSTAWSNGLWNMVFVGCIGAPLSFCGTCPGNAIPPCNCVNCHGQPNCSVTCSGSPYTTIAQTPIIAEKPYITSAADLSSYSLIVPQVEINKVGTSQTNNTQTITIDFSQVYIANPSDISELQTALSDGYHAILTPGVYNLTTPLLIENADTVVLGIGFPILISTTGEPCIVVGSVNGVRVGGMILQAGPSTDPITPTLLQWGAVGGDPTITSGFLYDCFPRIGRFTSGGPFNQTDLCIQINSANVVCDNLWIWRADHDANGLVYNEDNASNTGLEVNGDSVTIYGLASEHHIQDLIRWNGNFGACYFYQAEFPYDVTPDYEAAGYVGYRVASSVTHHLGVGVGVYSYFRDYIVTPNAAISAPPGNGIQFINALTRYLNGNGGISSVLNSNLGMNTIQANNPAVNIGYPGPTYLCDFSNQTMNARIRKYKRF